MLTEAFKKGLLTPREYKNPYNEDSQEFDDYERGRTQRIKRGSNNPLDSTCFSLKEYWDIKDEPVCEEWFEPNDVRPAQEILAEFKSYARIKNK